MSGSAFPRRIFKLSSVIVLCSMLVSGWDVRASRAAPDDGRELIGRQASLRERCLNAADVLTAKQPRSEALRFVGAQPGHPIPHPDHSSQSGSAEEAARGYISACAGLFGISDADAEMATMRSSMTGDRRSVVRFQQMHHGVPVLAGETIVMLDGQRNVMSVVNKFALVSLVDTTPAVEPGVAVQNAVQAVGREYGLDEGDLSPTVPELWIYDPVLLNPMDTGSAVLVWRLEVTSEFASVDELVLVDAEQGRVALMFSQLGNLRGVASVPNTVPESPEAAALPSSPQVLGTPLISIYTMNHATSPLPGTLVCTQVDPTACNSDSDAQKAYLYVLHTYQYYASMFSRDSMDNLGMPLIASVHYGAGVQNAMWNGDQLIFGDGFSQAEDVVAGELTHVLTDYESNLLTYYQSGAINESISDLFGQLIEKANQGDADWQIGEGLSIGSVRNMADPTIHLDPDKMSSGDYRTTADDMGGIHHNSGIGNKAAYLMTDGGSFNGITVTGLGATKVARIYYEANANLLTSGSDYFDLYYALNQACLLSTGGTEGIVPADCVQVRNAANAVEMTTQPVVLPTYNLHAPLCTAPLEPSNLFFDDLETVVFGNWVYGAISSDIHWTRDKGYAHSGQWSLVGSDVPSAPTRSYASMFTDVLLPTNAYLHFYHAYGFYNTSVTTFDGGIVEYSTDGGSVWNDAGWLMAPPGGYNGYNGMIAFPTANPLQGHNAFVGDSHGYYSTRLDLSPLNGQNVRFRWLMGLTGTGYADKGWFVDDVRIYTCGHLFADVPVATKEWMEPWIDAFYAHGITTGCGSSPLVFCPENNVTRAEMAVFLLRAKHGQGYTPPAASHFFYDVPVATKGWMEPWIDEFYREGMTTGCGVTPLRFCPENQVTRAEMAVFILRSTHASGWAPPGATGIFSDVPVATKEWMQPWIEEFYHEGITTGCGVGPPRYCPENQTTRAEMAVFIGRAYGLYP